MMKIKKWVILNLPKREDRRFIATATAIRLGVPIDRIQFWHGYALEDFEDFDAARVAMKADMPALEALHPDIPDIEQGKFLMMWNVARYLRDLANRPGDIEGFVHDGLALHKPFRPSFKWFEDVITEIVTQDPEFKLLTFGLHNSWFNQLKRIDPITPTSLISRGILSWDNFGRIYSHRGAAWVLDRMLTQTWNVRSNSVIIKRAGEEDEWDANCYSTIQPLGSDYPTEWLGSDSFIGLRRKALTQDFGRLLG